MIIVKYTDNTYILKEVTKKLNIDLLNLLIIEFLNRRSELEDGASLTRAYRHLNYVVICCYASLSFETLIEFIESFLNECDIDFKYGVLSEKELDVLKPFLPVISIRKKDQHGGVNNDTLTIDPHVKILSDVLNTYPGIKTFSSCDGHLIGKNEANFYILFTAEKMKNLDLLSSALWTNLELVLQKYELPTIRLMFDYGDWPNIRSSYFEIRIQYAPIQQKEVFEAMNYLAELLTIKD